jgi:hypothetical protein
VAPAALLVQAYRDEVVSSRAIYTASKERNGRDVDFWTELR